MACKVREDATAWESWPHCVQSTRRVCRTKAKPARRPSAWVVVAGARILCEGAGGGKWLHRAAT
eukprot:3959712-Pleurochrysis_carterae.AAC.1